MSSGEALEAALALAEAQLKRLRQGDIDGYIAALDAYGDACTRLEAGVPPGKREAFARLIALDAEAGRLLGQSREALRAEYAPLSQRRRIAGAYFPASGLRGATIAQG